jgi:hypothetical protein
MRVSRARRRWGRAVLRSKAISESEAGFLFFVELELWGGAALLGGGDDGLDWVKDLRR